MTALASVSTVHGDDCACTVCLAATLRDSRDVIATCLDRLHDDDQVLNLTEAARLLRVSEKTLRQAIDAGDVPAHRVGAQWRLSRRALFDRIGGTS